MCAFSFMYVSLGVFNMIYLLLLATVSVAFAADAEAEMKQEESVQPIRVHDDERRYRFEDGLELIHSREQRQRQMFEAYRGGRREDHQGARRLNILNDDLPGPVILRTSDPLPNHGHPDIKSQNKIIADVYSPDYYQPTWIVDYRYLKTGGRDYTRGHGGQILILPKNIRTNEHKEFADFDSLLEHLRLSRLSERASRQHASGHGDEHDARRVNQNIDMGEYVNQQRAWKSNRRH